MGGAPKAKPETNSERNARLLAARKGDTDARALASQAAYQRRARRRSSLFGGPEAGPSGGSTTLGVNV